MMLFHMPKVVARDKPGYWHVWSKYEDSWYLLRTRSRVWPCGRDVPVWPAPVRNFRFQDSSWLSWARISHTHSCSSQLERKMCLCIFVLQKDDKGMIKTFLAYVYISFSCSSCTSSFAVTTLAVNISLSPVSNCQTSE